MEIVVKGFCSDVAALKIDFPSSGKSIYEVAKELAAFLLDDPEGDQVRRYFGEGSPKWSFTAVIAGIEFRIDAGIKYNYSFWKREGRWVEFDSIFTSNEEVEVLKEFSDKSMFIRASGYVEYVPSDAIRSAPPFWTGLGSMPASRSSGRDDPDGDGIRCPY